MDWLITVYSLMYSFLPNVWGKLSVDGEELNLSTSCLTRGPQAQSVWAKVVVTNYICSATLIRTVFKHATTTHELK